MKRKIAVSSVLVAILTCSTFCFARVSMPDSKPGIIAQTAQKDKAAIVLINSVVTGTAVIPSFQIVPGGSGGSGSVVGTWRSVYETTTFTANGRFRGNNKQTGAFRGTYNVRGNVIVTNYSYPSKGTVQFTFTVSGNTLTISHPQVGTSTYTRVGSGGAQQQPQTSADVVSNAMSLQIVRETGPTAKVTTEELSATAGGTGFIISPEGYIITNAHVVLAAEDPMQMLLNAAVRNVANELYKEVAQYYNISQQDKEKVVQVLLQKFMAYFQQNGQITDVNINYYVLSGVAAPGEDLKVKSWPAVVKKKGTVYEKVAGQYSWGRDIAVIKVPKEHLPTVTLGDSNKISVGDSVFVIGYPGISAEQLFRPESMLEPTVTRGVISAKRTLRIGAEAFQTDAAINPGNSGGPAFNMRGEVIGIATFRVEAQKTGVESVNFLLPINLAKEFMNELNVKNKHGILDKTYADALNAFWNKDAAGAMEKMKDVLALYPGHPYAQDYINECRRVLLKQKYKNQ